MRWLFAIIITALMFLPSSAQAWGASGHQVVCQIAYMNLTPTARREVDRLLPKFRSYGSFAEACNYPDQPPILGNRHWVNYARNLARVTASSGCGVNEGGTCIIRSFNDDMAILSNRSGEDEDRARSLFLIGHWVGDVHQPLHAGHGDDRGGNLVRVDQAPCVLRDRRLGIDRDQDNLHSVWDRCIIEVQIFLGDMGYRGETDQTNRLTRAQALAESLNANPNRAARRRWMQTLPWQWAGESYDMARRPQVGYCVRRGNACWYTSTRQTSDGSKTVPVDDAYLARFAPDVRTRLLQAGVRLAHVLNDALDPGYRR